MGGASPIIPAAELAGQLSAPVRQLRWYAVRTRSRHERVSSRQLEHQGIEVFLPLVTRRHRWSDRWKQVESPLFPGYTFVHIGQSAPERVSVLRAHGVVSFVGTPGMGTAIPDNQIHDIRTLLAHGIQLRSYPFLKIGQRVRIRGGSLDGVEGILIAQHGDRSLVISVEPIQRSLSIRVEGYDVEPA
jgi:transcription antitermination factor NusG